jgi:hypothetical protein
MALDLFRQRLLKYHQVFPLCIHTHELLHFVQMETYAIAYSYIFQLPLQLFRLKIQDPVFYPDVPIFQ